MRQEIRGEQIISRDCLEVLNLIPICVLIRNTFLRVFLCHIGIDDFGAINSSRGAVYGNYILKSVADCMKECLSDSQRIYHLVADQYVIVDLEHSAGEYAAELKKKIDNRLYRFIVSENYEAVFSISVGVVDATTFCEGYEECRKKFAFVLKKAKKNGKKWILYL